MKFLSSARTQRNTLFMVLLVWLFALASGVANACLLQPQETHSHVAAVGFPETAQSPARVPAHAGAVADGANDTHDKAPCLKVCDDGSRSFTKQDSTVAQADPGPALLAVVLWRRVTPVIPALRQLDDEQPAMPGLPIRVRFPRLTL